MTNVLICGFPVSLANNIIHNGGLGGGGGLNPQNPPPPPPRSATGVYAVEAIDYILDFCMMFRLSSVLSMFCPLFCM